MPSLFLASRPSTEGRSGFGSVTLSQLVIPTHTHLCQRLTPLCFSFSEEVPVRTRSLDWSVCTYVMSPGKGIPDTDKGKLRRVFGDQDRSGNTGLTSYTATIRWKGIETAPSELFFFFWHKSFGFAGFFFFNNQWLCKFATNIFHQFLDSGLFCVPFFNLHIHFSSG